MNLTGKNGCIDTELPGAGNRCFFDALQSDSAGTDYEFEQFGILYC